MTDNTERSFRDKWEHNQQLAFSATLEDGHEISRWILERNGFAGKQELERFLADKTAVLDAGCGNGRVTALLRQCSSPVRTRVVGVDLVAAEVARANLAGCANLEVRQADLLGDLSSLGQFDFIYCQEVLHHTADPERAFRNLCGLLRPGGLIAIYVYKRKAPAREFVDDYVRGQIAGLPYDEAMRIARQITALGKALAELHLEVDVPPVEVLEIPEGRYDLQRFLYHFFMKCFWNPKLNFEENAAINYDWYHPQLCSRHTLDEIRQWFGRAGLQVMHEYVDFYGITMHGRRP